MNTTATPQYNFEQVVEENRQHWERIEAIKKDVATTYDNINNPEPFILPPPNEVPIYEQVEA